MMTEQDDTSESFVRRVLTREPDPALPASAQELLAAAAAQEARGRRNRLASLVVAVLMGGLALLVVRGEPDMELAPRGIVSTPAVGLEWLVEGPDGPRRGSDVVRVGERVIFAPVAPATGFLCIDEARGDGWARVLPLGREPWPASKGRNLAQSPIGEPLAFTTDEGPGPRDYRVLWSPSDALCEVDAASSVSTLRWAP